MLEQLSAEKQSSEEQAATEEAEQEPEPPEPYLSTRGRAGGRPKMMSEGECRVAADCLRSGIGAVQAWHEINARRQKRGKALIKLRETVRLGAFSVGIVKRSRMTTKTGSKNKDSAWAKARLAQAKQLKAQLAPRVLSVDRGRRNVPLSSAGASALKIALEQIFWVDVGRREAQGLRPGQLEPVRVPRPGG